MGDADAGVEKPKIVVYLGDRPHGAPGVMGGPFLVDRDGGGEPLYLVHVWLLHLAQELAGVGGEGLDITPLSLGVDGVEGQ